jgi:signal peptidase II
VAGAIVRALVPPGASFVVLPHLLSVTFLHNTGVAFGLLGGSHPAALIALALTILGILFYNKGAWPGTRIGQWGLGLMLGGALSNVFDRIRLGYVVDYLDVHLWPVFNLADAALVIGAGLLLLALSRSASSRG